MRTSASNWRDWPCFWPWRAGFFPPRGADAKPDKKKSQAALQRGKKADEAGKRDAAIAAYTEAIQADASNVEAWRARGRITRPPETASWRRPISIRPSRCSRPARRTTWRAADFFAAIGQPERAIHDYTLAMNLKLERSDIYAARGKAYTEVRQFDKAEEDFTQAIKLRLDNPEPYLGRGIARAEQRKYRDAVEDFDSCIARKPDHEECWVERALAFTGFNDFTHALTDLNQALKLNPEDLRAWRVRGAVRERLGDDRARWPITPRPSSATPKTPASTWRARQSTCG